MTTKEKVTLDNYKNTLHLKTIVNKLEYYQEIKNIWCIDSNKLLKDELLTK